MESGAAAIDFLQMLTNMCHSHLFEDVNKLCVASQEVLSHVLLQAEGAICLH